MEGEKHKISQFSGNNLKPAWKVLSMKDGTRYFNQTNSSSPHSTFSGPACGRCTMKGAFLQNHVFPCFSSFSVLCGGDTSQPLLLTGCGNDQFTCNDGVCISMDHRSLYFHISLLLKLSPPGVTTFSTVRMEATKPNVPSSGIDKMAKRECAQCFFPGHPPPTRRTCRSS